MALFTRTFAPITSSIFIQKVKQARQVWRPLGGFIPRKSLIALGVLALVTACGGSQKTAPVQTASPALSIIPADLVEISTSRLVSGVLISGSLQAKKQADLRAEVPAIVLQVLKDNGDKVQKDDVLVRLDDTTFRQALSSAQEAERVAQQGFDQAVRQALRLKTLSRSGAISSQAMEDAELRRNVAASDLASAHTRVVQDAQQLARTQIRAPFAGVVANREVSNGDTAQTGKALLKVIDPASIRFAGFVAADQFGQIQIGQAVNFTINGRHDRTYDGRVESINPVADVGTRQVGVQVALVSRDDLTVGIFAEGRVYSSVTQGLSIPESSLVRQGDHVYVWRVSNSVLNKIEVQLGGRNDQTGDYTITAGLNEGDFILRHPSGVLVDGAKVSLEKPPAIKQEP